jgi:hypothetical protein
MSDDSTADQRADDDGDGLKEDILRLTVPVLTFQRGLLEIAKRTIQDVGQRKPVQRLLLTELRVLRKILDPSGERLGEDFEKKIEGAFDALSPKLVAASLGVMEAQETILSQVMQGLTGAGAAEKADSPSA